MLPSTPSIFHQRVTFSSSVEFSSSNLLLESESIQRGFHLDSVLAVGTPDADELESLATRQSRFIVPLHGSRYHRSTMVARNRLNLDDVESACVM